MALFSLTSSIFKVPGNPGVHTDIGILEWDEEQVLEVISADLDNFYDIFELEHVDGVWKLSTSLYSISGENQRFDLRFYVEYIERGGMHRNALVDIGVFGMADNKATPSILYMEGLASKVGETQPIVLHCENLDEESIRGLSVFIDLLDSPESFQCFQVSEDTLVIDLEKQTISFTVTPDMLGDDVCATYSINLGYGTCERFDIFENRSNIGLIRYKYDGSNDVKTSNSAVSGENSCWFKSDLHLVEDVPTGSVALEDVSNGAGSGFGDTIYVRSTDECPCEKTKFWNVRLKYNYRLDRRKGELNLDGVQLREGDIVWLAAQFDGTDGLWRVSSGDWIGLGGSDDGAYDPCYAGTVPLKVDCNAFIDLGARVTEPVKVRCSDDVPVKHGSQTVCSVRVTPGDIVYLENQTDGQDGIWQVTCADWVYLGYTQNISGTTLDMTESVIWQHDIDFCACGGTFHIDYYFLNASCYLNHVSRTVKVLCRGASIVPNGDNQVIITDYSIMAGADSELVANVHGTPGDPIREDCVERVTTYDSEYALETNAVQRNCDSSEMVVAPDCREICDCERYYSIRTTDKYSGSFDSNGFTIVFWEHMDDGWHLYGYIGRGNRSIGMNYSVMHLKCDGMATVQHVDLNEELEWSERNALGVVETHRTHDAWFVSHDPAKEYIVSARFSLVDPNWEFKKIDQYGDPIPHEFTPVLDADSLYQNWKISQYTLFLARYGEDGQVEGTRGVYGFRYYTEPLSKAVFTDIYNSGTCRGDAT